MAVVVSGPKARGIVGLVTVTAASLAGAVVFHGGAHAAPPQNATARYAVFGHAPKQADAVPLGLAGQEGGGQTRAIGGRPGFSTWATVDGQSVCVSGFDPGTRPDGQLTPSTACAPQASVDANGGVEVGTTTYTHDGVTTIGVDALVPDGASATLTLANGDTEKVPVVNNAVQYSTSDSSTAPTRLVVTNDGVAHSFDLGVQ